MNGTTRRTASAALGSALLLLLAGCASGGGDDPGSLPPRPAVAIEDQVGAVDPARLVGRWDCRELNPYPDRPAQAQTMVFEAGGKARNEAVVDMARQGGPLPGRMRVDHAYDWRVEGERVVAGNARSTVKAADGSAATGMMAGMAQFVINNLSGGAEPGTMDVLRLDGRELVVRAAELGEAAPVIGCTRST